MRTLASAFKSLTVMFRKFSDMMIPYGTAALDDGEMGASPPPERFLRLGAGNFPEAGKQVWDDGVPPPCQNDGAPSHLISKVNEKSGKIKVAQIFSKKPIFFIAFTR